VKVAAGDVAYNGYVFQEADVMYYYAGVGPNSLSLGIAIYSDAQTNIPMVSGFGLEASPSTKCNETDDAPYECRAPFVLYHDLERMDECEVSFFMEAGIHLNTTLDITTSEKYAAWYLQAGGYESPMDAVNLQPTCDELEALHRFTNQLPGPSVYSHQLPFDGFRDEVWAKLYNSVQTMPALGQFWRPAYLDDGSVFHSLYFSSYQGLFTMFPALKAPSTYNALIRPWYQRASSYPGTLIFTTPYVDAFTGALVASGAVTIEAPDTSYPFGVAAFDYEFTEFLSFWDATMSDVCDQSAGQYCYLVDSSAFLLWFDGIENHLEDADISHKFLGEAEPIGQPALMQSLLELGFFTNCTHDNYLENTRDISYMANEDKYIELEMNSTAHGFSGNNGEYKVHKVGETNLYLIHIEDYQQAYSSAPDAITVQAPGCITANNGQCISVVNDVCTYPDELVAPVGMCTAPIVDDNVICILEKEVKSDMCASVYTKDCDHYDAATSASSIMAVIVAMACAILFQ